MRRKQIDEFEILDGQMKALYTEMGALVRKNPNDALNRFKLRFVNSLLGRVNDYLGEKRLPLADFKKFSEDEIPSTSDVLMIIGQYLSALEKVRADTIYLDYGAWYWKVEDDEEARIRTGPPKKISE